MKLTPENTEFLCEIAVRKLEKPLRSITPVFIIHKDKTRTKMLERQKEDILEFENGDLLFEWLKSHANKNTSELPGLYRLSTKEFFGLYETTSFIAPVFLNIENHQDKTQTCHTIFYWLWHAITLAQSIKQTDNDQQQTSNIQLFQSDMPLREKAKNNLKADIFAGFITESDQEAGFIEKLAAIRAHAVLEKNPGTRCETHPYPQVAEACRFIYDDLKYSLKQKDAVTNFAFKMAEEITNTYGTEAIDQWLDFCTPAQHMVWMNYAKKDILNSAVFTSENTHTRATAHLICDQIGFKPEPQNEAQPTTTFYNPYAKISENTQHHKKLCQDLLQTALMNFSIDPDINNLQNLIAKQNEKLLSGNPLGWCADALSEVITAYNDGIKLDVLPEIFEEALANTPWKTLSLTAEHIISLKRKDQPFSITYLAEKLDGMNGAREILKTLGGSSQSDFNKAQSAEQSLGNTIENIPLHVALENAGQQILDMEDAPEKEKAAH